MANPEHIAWLLEGVESWNNRRKHYRDEREHFIPDLEDADLFDAFRRAGKLNSTRRIPLAGFDLIGANLEHANLMFADLRHADLTLADLSNSNLCWAYLINAKLEHAKLVGANLTATEPWKANLFSPAFGMPEQHSDEGDLITTVEEMLTRIQRIKSHYEATTTLYFRGERECGWKLRPSVMRSDLAQVESEMLTDLMTQRPDEFNGMTTALAHWVLAQHHGLQTRFLDITKNPLVALFHACDNADQSDSNRSAGRLHVFAVPRSLVRTFNSDDSSTIANFAKLHRRKQDAILGKSIDLLGNRFRRPNDHPEAIEALIQVIRQEKPSFDEQIDPRDFYRVFVVEPQQSSERIRAQSGAFLMSAFHERFERAEIVGCNREIPVYAHYKLTISGESKDEIMESLRLLNISRENLFPGLDSSAESIAQSYTAGIKKMREEDRRRRANRVRPRAKKMQKQHCGTSLFSMFTAPFKPLFRK